MIAQHLKLSNEHFTPYVIVEAARATMGGIDLDPASNELANEHIVKAKTFFSIEDDGLSKYWSGRIFLNPPGGTLTKEEKESFPFYTGRTKQRSRQAAWCELLRSQWEWRQQLNGDINTGRIEAIFVSFNLEIQCHCPWILDLPCCILSKRPRYLSWDEQRKEMREGQPKKDKNGEVVLDAQGKLVWSNSPSHPGMIIYFPDTKDRAPYFKKYFSKLGKVINC